MNTTFVQNAILPTARNIRRNWKKSAAFLGKMHKTWTTGKNPETLVYQGFQGLSIFPEKKKPSVFNALRVFQHKKVVAFMERKLISKSQSLPLFICDGAFSAPSVYSTNVIITH